MTTPSADADQAPANSIDIESKEAQDLFTNAFKGALPEKAPEAAAVVTTTEATQQTTEPTREDKVVAEAIAKVEEKSQQPSSPAEETAEVQTSEYSGPDWAKDLPEPARAKILELVDRDSFRDKQFRMEASRQTALQQKLYNARRQAESLRAKLQQQSTEAAGRSDAAKTIAEWNQLIEADPNLAKAIELRIAAEREQLRTEFRGQLDATVDPLYQHSESNYVESQHKMLEAEVPNYKQVINSPVYKYWIDNVAAPGLRDLAQYSTEYSDAVQVLRAYAADAQNVYSYMVDNRLIETPQQVQQQQSVEVVQQPTQVTSRADKVAQSRQQKVQAAPVVSQQHAPSPVSPSAVNNGLNGRPGDMVDLDNDAVAALFADAYNKTRGVRL